MHGGELLIACSAFREDAAEPEAAAKASAPVPAEVGRRQS